VIQIDNSIMSFNIRRYLGIDGSPSAVNHDNKKNPIPDELLDRCDKDLNELIGYITGAKKASLPEKPPATKGDFENHLKDKIKNDELTSFYPPNDPRIAQIAEQAAGLLNNPNYPLKDPYLVAEIAKFCLYEVVLYCDDSLSMTQQNRIQLQIGFVRRLARLITPFREGTITLRFINANAKGTAWDNMSNVDTITNALQSVPYTGYTQIGGYLKSKILEPCFYAKLRSKTFKKPLMVIIITDGWPYAEAENHMRNVIHESINEIPKHLPAKAKPTAIKYQINQIGHEERSTKFIQGLHNDEGIKPNVYCTSEILDDKIAELKSNEKGLNEWIVNTLTKRPQKEHRILW